MVGIGLGVLWIGYTAFAYGRALTKGAKVTFTDMVLPSHRAYAVTQITSAKLPSGSSGGLVNSILNLGRPSPAPANASQAGGEPTGKGTGCPNGCKTFHYDAASQSFTCTECK